MTSRIGRCFAGIFLSVLVAACATVPGGNYPKHASSAIAHPENTPLGDKLKSLAGDHPGTSGFELLPLGHDSLRARLELADAAQRTLDLQYFIIQNDTTGKLVMEAVLRAAERGTRVRMLVDDYDDLAHDQRIATLAAHPGIEIRIFNPYYLRGPLDVLRNAEFLLFSYRLNSRMHNKLFIADNAAAVVGGRTSATSISRRARNASAATSTFSQSGRLSGSSRRASTHTGTASWRSRSRRYCWSNPGPRRSTNTVRSWRRTRPQRKPRG